MRTIKSVSLMSGFSDKAKKRGKTIGLVPTMGYLHDGHLSLVKAAAKNCDLVVVSIFVNPTQFGPGEDLNKYPRDLKRDLRLLAQNGADIVFAPETSDVYEKDHATFVEVSGLSDNLCGRSRPGHFRGVATIVAKLFNIIRPDMVFFGLKDFQQQAIIKKMVKDLNMGVKVISMPTVREKDGLAMSSRNTYLDPVERKRAAVIAAALRFGRDMIRSGVKDPLKIKRAIGKMLLSARIRIDYVSICDPDTLNEIYRIKGKSLIAVAVHVGKTRLIDNMLV